MKVHSQGSPCAFAGAMLSLLNKTSLCQKTADVCGVKHIINSSFHFPEDVAGAAAMAYVLQR